MLLKYILAGLFVMLGLPLRAQKTFITLGETRIPIDQYFTISVGVEGGEIKTVDCFPEIEGFKKSSRFATTKTTTVAGVATVTKSVTQRYAALEEGRFELKPFTLRVNKQTVSARGAAITVMPMGAEPEEDGLGREEEEISREEQGSLDLNEEAFLSVSTSKKEAYVGEGVQATLWFYLATSNQHLFEFYDFANQIPVLIRQLRQKNAWEESIEQIGEVLPEKVTVEGREYLRYRLHSAVYYPLNTVPLSFPTLSLKMTRFKFAGNATFAGENRQKEVITYTSRIKAVAVKELPPHPLRLSVPVGNYRLREAVKQTTVESGQNFTYGFQVEGEGNLAAVQAPALPLEKTLEIYPPEVTQQIDRLRAGITGSKAFKYHALARQPGRYDLGNYFSLIYFNPAAGQYDTLRSQVVVQVTGEENANAAIQSKDLGPFYNLIHTEDNTLESVHKFEETKRYTNLVLLFLLAMTLFMFFKK
jgi:hypothetical protein